jgi:curved DNA-binding protein CbpA
MTKREALTILGLRAGATLGDIKAAYRFAAKITHPDRGGNRSEFERVTKAYRILTGREREDTLFDPKTSTPWIS